MRVTQSQSSANKGERAFPLEHISYSALVRFSSNPILFKILDVNRDYFDSSRSITAVIGQAFHAGMEVYNGGSDTAVPSNEAEAIELGLKAAMDYLENHPDGFIRFTTTVPNKQKAFELLSFAFSAYVKECPYKPDHLVSSEGKIIEQIDVEWRGKRLALPVKLKGYIDKIIRENGELVIEDYKTCMSFSDPEKIDGAKMLQAVEYYFLVHAKYGEAPVKMRYREVKMSKNKDGSPQVRTYEVVYAENEMFFDFYFRFYEDVIRALNGEQVYVPNVHALFENEIAIIAYINRLDLEEERARLMSQHKVTNITDLLKKEIHRASSMNKLLKAMEGKLVEAKSINYHSMSNDERIKTKLLEHGIILQFDSMVSGASVDLYRFMPSIGIKMSRLKGYAADIEQVLGVSGVRILAPIPNSVMVGFEVPRAERSFPKVPKGEGFDVAIGQDLMGKARRFDIRTAPHLLVAGATGSGKSVFLDSLISQLARIPNAELHLFDPKRVELSRHKRKAVEYASDRKKIVAALQELSALMEKRYKQLEKQGARSIEEVSGMPYKFVVIDEFSELMLTSKDRKVFEELVLRLAQMARAAGIHIILTTQRPSTDVISGTIRNNFPTKAVFRMGKATDSVVVMDDAGAERLLGKGDMFFVSDKGVERLQGYIT